MKNKTLSTPQISGLSPQPSDDVLVRVENVSKKFCRTLKGAMWYGVKDMGAELIGRGNDTQGKTFLRPDEFWAVQDVSFELKRGECLGLIGHNGAGKSTLLKMLNGLIKPDHGKITMKGRVGAIIELNVGFNPILTGRENVYIYGSILGFSKKEIDQKYDAIVEFAELDEFMEMPFLSYSSGMKVRLGFAVAVQMEPDVLIIDEVLAVGDIGFRVKCLNRMSELLAKSAVIFVSHAMPQVMRMCSNALLVKKGERVILSPDISKVIDLYYQGVDTGKQVNTISEDFEVTNVRLNGESVSARPVVPFGGQLQIEIDCRILTKCKKIQLQIIVWNQDQRPVLDILTEDFQPYSWENDSKNVSLSIVIPLLRLSGGKYTIVIWVADQESMEILCRIENAATFVMGHHISTVSELLHPAHWSRQNNVNRIKGERM